MATMEIPIRRMMNCKPMIDQHGMWMTEGIVLGSVKIDQYISDMENTIVLKKILWPVLSPKKTRYFNKWQNLKAKHK